MYDTPIIGASVPLHLLSLSKKKFPFTVLVSWNFYNDLSDGCLATEAETAEKILRVQGRKQILNLRNAGQMLLP